MTKRKKNSKPRGKVFECEFSLEGYATVKFRAKNQREADAIAKRMQDAFSIDSSVYYLKGIVVEEANDNLEADADVVWEDEGFDEEMGTRRRS